MENLSSTAKGGDSKQQRSSATNDTTDRQGKRRLEEDEFCLEETSKGGESKRKRSSEEVTDFQGKRRLEGNEFCLQETSKVLALGTGESGVANKIVGYVQDYLRLDSINCINNSNCVGEVCLGLEKLLDAKIADEAFVFAVLVKLNALHSTRVAEYWVHPPLAKFIEKNGLELLTQSMTLHPSSSRVQQEGFFALATMTMNWCGDVRRILRGKPELMEGKDLNKLPSFLASKSCKDMAVMALENHQDVPDTAAAAVRMMDIMISPYTYIGHAPYCLDHAEVTAHLQYLQEANVLPLCWSLLPKHITHTKFVTSACNILTLWVGGVHRPVLKKLLAETPQVDELLAKLAETLGQQNVSVVHLYDEYNEVRGQVGP